MNIVVAQRTAIPTSALGIAVITLMVNDSMLGLVAVAMATVLVVMQWAVYRSYRNRTEKQEDIGRLGVDLLILSGTLIACYLLILILAWVDLSAWPSAGSLWNVFVFVSAIGLVFQVLMWLSWFKSGRLPLRRLVPRATAIALGWGLSLGMASTTAKIALSQVEDRHRALFNGLSVSENRCPFYNRYLSSYEGPRPYAPRSLYSSALGYQVIFLGRSADIDGSTIVFDSATEQWEVIHNDRSVRLQELNEQQSAMTICPDDSKATGIY